MSLIVTYNVFPEAPKDEKVPEFIGCFISFLSFFLLLLQLFKRFRHLAG